MTPPRRRPRPGPSRPGSTLVEIMIVALLVGIFAAMAIPSYRRSVEQARVDMAAANLRAIWAAERLHRLQSGQYAADPREMPSLSTGGHEIAIVGASSPVSFRMYGDRSYTYRILIGYDGSFSAEATRAPGAAFGGALTIDESGYVGGQVADSGGRAVRPGYQ